MTDEREAKAPPPWWLLWWQAIDEYLEANPKDSMRQLSIRAVGRPGYLSGNRKLTQMPNVDNFIAVCEQINVSAVGILLGVRLSRDDQDLVEAVVQAHPDARGVVRDIVRKWRQAGKELP